MEQIKDIYFQYNPWWEGDMLFVGIIARPEISGMLYQQLNNKSIVILTGLRRPAKQMKPYYHQKKYTVRI
jgi:hypothetical protein